MKQMNYSSITALLRRIHRAKAISDDTGIPVKELMDRDRELRKQSQQERRVQEQRRDFLKTAGGIGLGAGVMSASSMALAGNHNTQPEIAIIGAGAGGLRTAHRLMQYGIDSTIYEANTRVGGRMYSNRDFFADDRVVEWGGEFISTEHTALRNLVHQLGLKLEDANKLSLGEEETYSIGGQLYSEADLLDEWVGGLYGIMKQALKDAPWQPQYNTVHTAKHIEYDDRNAIDWMASVGYGSNHWVHKLLLTDLVAEYGITDNNSALNLIYLLGYNPRSSGGLPLAGTDERFHVVGGNDLVMTGMADELPSGTIQLDHKLVKIDGDHAGPYTLHFETANGTFFSPPPCDVLVMALPINLIKDIEIDANIQAGWSDERKMAFHLPGQTLPNGDPIPDENVSDNGKVMLEFSDRFWDRTTIINGETVHQAARAYSDPDKFISTWEGEPGNPSPLGVLVDYNGGFEARSLASTNLHGPAVQADVDRFLAQAQQIWGNDGPNGTDIESRWITGQALVSNWIDDPFARSAFVSPSIKTMTTWWGAQWEPDGNIYYAGEAYDEEYWSYMNGAIASAERVAKEIHQNY